MKTTLALCALAACGPTTSKTTAAETGSHGSQFAYDATGLPTRITTDGVAHDIGVPPRDALGRATSVGGATLAYGPDGALARATVGADTFEYITDETGHRLAKKKNGAFVEAYVDEGVVSDTLYSPVAFAGTTLGVVHHGAFETIATDPRGTLLADAAGVTRAQTFGERVRASTLGSAIDYARSGRDADLGVIRMGVRDYDPASHEFLTPDPLFLASPEKCVTSPVECNLYSYARNRPADFVDPSGTEGVRTAVADPEKMQWPVSTPAQQPGTWKATSIGPVCMAPDQPPADLSWAVGSRNYYQLRQADFDNRHQMSGGMVTDYYLNYGDKYLNRFLQLRSSLETWGQWFVDGTLPALQRKMEFSVQRNPMQFAAMEQTPGALRDFAFRTHVSAYEEGGALGLSIKDGMKVGMTPDVRDVGSLSGLDQVRQVFWHWAQNKIGQYP